MKILATGDTSDQYTHYQFTRSTTETAVASSDPGQLLAGANLTLNADSVRNAQSQIIAGANLNATVRDLQNIGTPGERITTDNGTATAYRRQRQGGHDTHRTEETTYAPASVSQTITVPLAVYQEHTSAIGSGTELSDYKGSTFGQQADGAGEVNQTQRSQNTSNQTLQTDLPDSNNATGPGAVHSTQAYVKLPNSSLYNTTPNNNNNYLIETDPRFADYRSWLSSDYLLDKLKSDPATTQKRLGDGFYEQRLLQQQITQLTGQRYLPGYNNDEEQYKALMTAGVSFATEFNLKPGIALSTEQIGRLTSDIVWLVEQQVMLADGTTTTVLAPQIYALPQDTDLAISGALLGGKQVNIDSQQLHNEGTVLGQQSVAITTGTLDNIGGQIAANTVDINATQDISNLGGLIQADSRLTLNAGRDINIESLTRETSNRVDGNRFERVTIAGLGRVNVRNPDGQLYTAAGRNINLTAAHIINNGENSSTTMTAGKDINLATVETRGRDALVWDSRNYATETWSEEIGSQINTSGSLQLLAGNDLRMRGAQVEATQGDLQLNAGGDIEIEAAERSRGLNAAGHSTSRSYGSKRTLTTRDTIDNTYVKSSILSGQTITLNSGEDTTLRGAQLVADGDTQLTAGGDINVLAATETRHEERLYNEKKSGLFSSGSFGVTVGTKRRNDTTTTDQVIQQTSTLGSLDGDVNINAGNDVTITASDLLARQGDIRIEGDNVSLNSADDKYLRRNEVKTQQSGLTLAISGGVVDTIDTIVKSAERIDNADDDRLKALHAWRIGRTVDDVSKGADNLSNALSEDGEMKDSGVNLSLSIGASSSTDTTTNQSTTALGSSALAEGDVEITARGDAERDTAEQTQGDIHLQGALVEGNNIKLDAKDEIELVSAENTSDEDTQSKSSSAGIGISIGSDGLLLYVEASKSRGEINQSSDQYLETQLNAKQTAELTSGGDTILEGAQVNAERIIAKVGKDLTIQSQQDAEHYRQRQESLGGKVGIGLGGGSVASANINYSKLKADSDYRAVQKQSGLFAGKGGFDVNVGNNTDLQGGAIVSDANTDNNHLSTETLTYNSLHNKAEYDVESMSISAGTSGVSGGGYSSDIGSAANTTYAAISDGNIEVRSQPGMSLEELDNLKRSKEEAHETLERIFNEGMIDEAREQMELTQIAGEEIYQAIGDLGKVYDEDGNTIGYDEGYEPGGQFKTTLHALAGGLVATLGGGDFLAGATGAGLPHALSDEIGKLPTSEQRVLTAVLLGVAAGAVSGDGVAGGYTGLYSRQFNDEKTIAEQEATIAKLLAECQQLNCDLSGRVTDDASTKGTASAYIQELKEGIEALGETAAAITISVDKNGGVATLKAIGEALFDEAQDLPDLPRETLNQLEILGLKKEVARQQGDIATVERIDAQQAVIVTGFVAGAKGLAIVTRQAVESMGKLVGSGPEGTNVALEVDSLKNIGAKQREKSGLSTDGGIPEGGVEISNNNARQLLEKSRNTPPEKASEIVDSFDGKIKVTQGKQGDQFTITETGTAPGQQASGSYVTRESAGSTPAERIENLALPKNNTADVEGNLRLTRDQVLLEGKVKSQAGDPDFHPNAHGGGKQVHTDAYNDGVERVND